VVTGDALLVGACSGTFYAFNKKSGQVLWTYDIKQDGKQSSFHGNVVLSKGRVFVGTDRGTDPAAEGHIYAFDPATGKVAWKYAAATGVSADLLLDGSRLIAYGANGEIVALSSESGAPAWKKKITAPDPDRYMPSPALLDHTVFAATTTGAVVALRAADGELLWRRQLDAGYLQTIVVGNELYVLNSSKYLYHLEKTSGEVTTREPLPAAPVFYPSPAGDAVLVEFSDRTLKRIHRGKTQWSRGTGGDWSSHRPLILENQVVVADETGRLSAWTLENGESLWSTVFQRRPAPITTIAADSELFYVGTQDGTLFAVDRHKLEGKK
jgi:outer membrane protein assembly factor BamB